jgi:hypothetical protein
MRTRPLAALGLAAVLLTACGGSDDNGESAKKGPQVSADAASALEKAGAVHLTGSGSLDGQQTTVDLHLQGQDATGTIGQGSEQLKIVETGGKLYAQAPSGFWSKAGVPESAAGALAGKWVIVPSQAAGQLMPFSLKSLADQLRHPTGATIRDDVHTSTLHGTKVVVVTQTDGSTLDVAATGTPYPLRTVDKGSNAGTVDASDFGKKVTITAPSGALDLSQLSGAGA